MKPNMAAASKNRIHGKQEKTGVRGTNMSNATFEVTVPPALVQYGFSQDHVQRNVNEWLVLSLFTDSHISSGKAANLLGISRIDFLALLRKRGIAYIDYSAQELAEEFDAVDELDIERTQ